MSEKRVKIYEFCKKNLAPHATNPRVFGSVARGSDTDESDLDILVDTSADTTLFGLGAIRYKLRNLLGVSVDVLTPDALSENFVTE